MNCIICGAKMKKARKEPYHFTESGLPYIYLEGCERYDCTNEKCGENEISIPNIPGLMCLIAEIVSRQRRKLLPSEIRFLRTYLGFSGVDFAKHISVSPETVSRWEKGTVSMKDSMEKFLRILVLSKSGPFRNYGDLKKFAEVKQKKTVQRKFTFIRSQWKEKQVA